MNPPAVEHLGDVVRRMTGGQEPRERVPVVAALGPRIRVGAELERQLAIDDAKMRGVARVGVEHGIECRLEIGLAEVIPLEVIFVGVGKRRITGLPQCVSEHPQAVGRQQIVGIANVIATRGVEAGVLANAVAAESLTSVLIAINRRYKVPGAGIRITGLPPSESR